MFVHYVILGISMIMIVNGFPWTDIKDSDINKLSVLQHGDDSDLLDELNSLIEKMYANNPNMLDLEDKSWSDNKDTPYIDNSDKTSHALAVFLTYNPLPSCQEKFLINMKQFISCVKEIEENIRSKDFSKRGKGMMKLNPTGWKRKRRDTLATEARARNSQTEYNLNRLINQLLMQKRQKMRFNPTGW